MELELVSFKLCPFVQSTLITLLNNNVAYNITYIDINDPPQWFEELSPTGQVPILKVDNDNVIFESAVINEFINDACQCNILPDDPLQRALQRSWAQYASSLFTDLFNIAGAETESTVDDIVYDINEKLEKLENLKPQNPYFNGEQPGLIDSYFAGFFMRAELLKPALNLLTEDSFPVLHARGGKLMELDCVKNSVVKEFPQMYTGMLKARGGHLGSQF